jgi:hypothetical protein
MVTTTRYVTLSQILTSENRGFVKVFLKAKRAQIILLEDIGKRKGIRI